MWTVPLYCPIAMACRWVAYADEWHLPHLLASALDFISSQRRPRSSTSIYPLKGVADLSTTQGQTDNAPYTLSFKAMLRAGRLDEDLQRLSSPTVIKVLEAAFAGKGCSECSGPAVHECMCTSPQVATYCGTCCTRFFCNRCRGWLDI
jgi:hypothetical protein